MHPSGTGGAAPKAPRTPSLLPHYIRSPVVVILIGAKDPSDPPLLASKDKQVCKNSPRGEFLVRSTMSGVAWIGTYLQDSQYQRACQLYFY
jgi:hypothetical protein